jgi:hypothetical protein
MTIVRRDLDVLLQQFGREYLHTPNGQRYLASYEKFRSAARRDWDEIRAKQAACAGLTELVLPKVLPHLDSMRTRARGALTCQQAAAMDDKRVKLHRFQAYFGGL